MACTRPHAVVLPSPAQGHINPMMHLSTKLARDGFTVTFVNSEHNQERILQSQRHKFAALLKDHGLDIRLIGIPDGLPPDHGRTSNAVELCEAIVKMEPVFEELVRGLMVEDPPVTCIIVDISVPYAQDVANRCGLPRVAFWTRAATYFASLQIVCKGQWPTAGKPGIGVSSSTASNLITCIPGAPPIKPTEMSSFLLCNDPSDFMFDFLTSPIRRVGEAAWILFNTFDELEAPALNALRKELKICTVGPLLPSAFFSNSLDIKSDTGLWQEEHGCLQWLDKQSPASVLYISFGSIAVLSEKQMQEFAIGLEASQQPFLWVVRPDLMTGNSAIFPEGFIDRVKDRASFVSWAPQLHVLSHLAVGGFVTHCGWNSTLEGISGGVRMLGWPYFGDQMMDCRLIADGWELGLRLEAEEEGGVVSRGEVEKKVRDVMQGEQGREIRERVGKMKEAARRAVCEGGSSHENWQLFVQGLKSSTAPL